MAEYENVMDELDAIISGKHDVSSDDNDDVQEITNEEDTDREEYSGEDTETNHDLDVNDEDTVDEDENEDEENTLVDDDGLEEDEEEDNEIDVEDAEDANATEKDSNKTDDSNSETNTQEPEQKDIEDKTNAETTDNVDYQKQYEELLEKSKVATEFYEKVAGAKFKANGKEVQGFNDPEKLIQAQQMAYNYSEKMAGFKQYRPYMGPLKERGMLDNPEKFDLAMSLIDGDKEALKKHIQDLGVDPMELDMDEINYTQERKTTSQEALSIEDAMSTARTYGVEDKVKNAIVNEWDDESFQDFVSNPKIQEDLVTHIADGSYDIVTGRIQQKSVLDENYAQMKMVDKYRIAVQDLRNEYELEQRKQYHLQEAQQENTNINVNPFASVTKNDTMSNTNTNQNSNADTEKYIDKVESNKVADEARKKAANASRPKSSSRKRKPRMDPMSMDGDGIASFLDGMIMGKK